MEILVAILWYLQLVFLNQDYTENQVNMLIEENHDQISVIKEDQKQTETILYDFRNELEGSTTNIIEVWEEDDDDGIIN